LAQTQAAAATPLPASALLVPLPPLALLPKPPPKLPVGSSARGWGCARGGVCTLGKPTATVRL
jgi:hypothetical protein